MATRITDIDISMDRTYMFGVTIFLMIKIIKDLWMSLNTKRFKPSLHSCIMYSMNVIGILKLETETVSRKSSMKW